MCIQITTVASRVFIMSTTIGQESNIAHGNEVIGSVPHNTRHDVYSAWVLRPMSSVDGDVEIDDILSKIFVSDAVAISTNYEL